MSIKFGKNYNEYLQHKINRIYSSIFDSKIQIKQQFFIASINFPTAYHFFK